MPHTYMYMFRRRAIAQSLTQSHMFLVGAYDGSSARVGPREGEDKL